MKDIKALFLGPKAENQELYESLIVEIIRDSCFLRKNFHPSDKTIITEADKLQPEYRETAALLRSHLNEILSELKKGVPWYHPRYIGHMFGDLMLPAVVGYFSTILYNPNNVVGEVSTATTRMELNYIDALCKMVGYRSCSALSGNNAWGHLCSGGTSANIEALWVARNMKYYPVTLKLLTGEFPFLGDVLINYYNADIKDLSCTQLFNLPPHEILDLRNFIESRCQKERLDYTILEKRIARLAVRTLGMHAFHKMVSDQTGEDLPLPLVYISKSSHYSWEKSMDILGLGQAQLVNVNMDNGYRMDVDDLHQKFNHQMPTLAIIGILGSSKQGSIDPIDDIIRFREQMEEQHKHSFFVHIDAA
jgi:glutamate/tyrosine decarboxylase-like PLP-dependent enzyme